MQKLFMKLKSISLFIVCLVLIQSIYISNAIATPQKTIKEAAKGIEKKDLETFTNNVDVPLLLMSQVQGLRLQSRKEKLDKSVTKFEQDLVLTGRIIMLSRQFGFPWEPGSLRTANVEQVTKTSAVAPVDSTIGLRNWLALKKGSNGKWKISGYFEKREQAVYWGSDQRLIDIKKENEKRIIEAKELTNRKAIEWEREKAEYDSALQKESKRKAFCKAEKQRIDDSFLRVLNKIIFSDIEIKEKQNMVAINVVVTNMNEKATFISTIIIDIVDLDGQKVCDTQSAGVNHIDGPLLPKRPFRQEWLFPLEPYGIPRDVFEGMTTGNFKIRIKVMSLVMDQTRFEHPSFVGYAGNLKLPEECHSYVRLPFDPGSKPDPVKPELLTVK